MRIKVVIWILALIINMSVAYSKDDPHIKAKKYSGNGGYGGYSPELMGKYNQGLKNTGYRPPINDEGMEHHPVFDDDDEDDYFPKPPPSPKVYQRSEEEIRQSQERVESYHHKVRVDSNLAGIDKDYERTYSVGRQISKLDDNDEYKERRLDLVSLAKESLDKAYEHYNQQSRVGYDDHVEEAQYLRKLACGFLDLATSWTPGVSFARDAYEAITGKDLISGEELSLASRTISLVSMATAGYGKKAITGINAISKLMRGKRTQEAYNYAKKIFETAQNVKPKLGNKYVKKLPELPESYAKEFNGHLFRGEYRPGEVLFQAQRKGQLNPGNWFTSVKPMDAADAEDLLNINKYGNFAEQIKAYVVKERVSGYAGKVTDGMGHQFHIPKDVPLADVIEEVIL